MTYGPYSIGTSTDPGATANTTNTLVTVANDATALAAWFDGTNQQVSYASAPYSSWTATQLMANHRFAVSLRLTDTTGNAAALACDNNILGIQYVPLPKSGATYTVGTPNALGASAPSTFNAGATQMIAKDGQGRTWAISNNNANTDVQVYYSATPTSGTWTSSLSLTTSSNANLPCADIIGNFLVVLYPDTSSTISYQRLDVSGPTLGSWSTPTHVTVTGAPGATSHFSFRGNGAGIGVFVYSLAAAGHTITAHTYTASSDTWSSATDLSTNTNDDFPTVCNAGGDVYVFWCQFAASNSYALVWSAWRAGSSSWDISTKTIVPSGTNISNPNVGYNATQQLFGITYTVGTGSPYAVNFLTMTNATPVLAVPASLPIISRVGGTHALTNDDFTGAYPASNANNTTYSDLWRCAAAPASNANSGTLTQSPAFTTPFPVYVAYDLSSVSSAQRQTVLAIWYNDPTTGAYRPDLIANNPNNIITAYTIDTNSAAGGTLPGSGWTTRATVTGATTYHSRQHLITMGGDNWIRINVTGIVGSAGNNNAQCNFDVFDAHLAYSATHGVQNDWIAYGDSITQAAFLHSDTILPQQVNNLVSTQLPIIEDGGIGGWTSTDLLPYFATFLALFPGQFVLINMGTNDANLAGTYLPTYRPNMDAMVKMVLAAGKIPIVQHIPWGGTANLLANVPTLNGQIDSIVANNPGTVKGWDAYAFFSTHQSDISGDNIHPTTQGFLDYQAQWAQWALQNIYSRGGDPTSFAFDTYHVARFG